MVDIKSENKSNIRLLVLLLFLGLVVRLLLPPFFIKGDLRTHFEWGEVLSDRGTVGSYDYTGWTNSVLTQPPLILLLYTFSHQIYEVRYGLAAAHNSIGFPPGFLISWFDRYGESVVFSLWAILGDLAIALVIYFLLFKITNSFRRSLIGLTIYLFNPISIFVSSLWGQSDLLSALFVLSSFYFFDYRKGGVISPFLFTMGLLIKPTAVILGPFYLFFVLPKILENKKILKEFILGTFLSIVIAFAFFAVFIGITQSYFIDLGSIIINRILPAAKGVSRASVSAFNLYSSIFIIDKTLAIEKFFLLTINQAGILFSVLIYSISIFLFKKFSQINKGFVGINFLIYFIVEGLFLFNSGMVERYFLLGLPPLIFLVILIRNSQMKWLFIIQNIIWFVNLFYSFFRRDFSEMATIFQSNNFAIIRLFSLGNIIIYLLIVFLVMKETIKQKNIQWNYQ
jgi:Gpi18-like mannosyltransferase